MTVLEAVNVGKQYGAFNALDGVSFALKSGEFVSIVGPNGAGKTTLVNVLTGLAEPTTGEVQFKGQNIAGLGPVDMSRQGVARSFQLVNIFPELTVRETIMVAVTSRAGCGKNMYRNLASRRDLQDEVEQVARWFGLTGKLGERCLHLPQGDKKLLDVASAFALRPEVILMDEPTSGVSTAEKNNMMKILIGAAQQTGIKTIIQIEHDMDLVFNYSDRIIALQDGRVIADATPEKLRADYKAMAIITGAPVR